MKLDLNEDIISTFAGDSPMESLPIEGLSELNHDRSYAAWEDLTFEHNEPGVRMEANKCSEQVF
jgi:hypothetical protein